MRYRPPAVLLAAAVLTGTFTGCGSKENDVVPVMNSNIEATATQTNDTTAAESTDETTSAPETIAEATTSASEPPADLVLTCLDSVEVYSDETIYSILTNKNVEILNGEDKVDTAETGAHTVTVKCSKDGAYFEKELAYNVTDSEAPVVLNSGNGAAHIVGTPFDLSNYVGFADNYDKAPTLTYSGDIDPDTLGSYPLTATVCDSSGNSTSWDLTINVAETAPPVVYDESGPTFDEFISQYGGESKRLGIDVSTWQGDIDFSAVKNAGCEFVMIRVGYCYDEEEPTLDDHFAANLANAKSAGLDVGIYYYSADNTPDKVKRHARWVAEQLGDTKLELPVAFDWEEFSKFQQYGMSIHDLNELYLQFADEMKKSGYDTILYSSKNFLNNFWTESTKAAYPVWLAHFIDETDYTGEYAMWQMSSGGTIDGIAGKVDLDILYS